MFVFEGLKRNNQNHIEIHDFHLNFMQISIFLCQNLDFVLFRWVEISSFDHVVATRAEAEKKRQAETTNYAQMLAYHQC